MSRLSAIKGEAANKGGGGMKQFTMTRSDFAAYEYLCRQNEAKKWLEAILNETVEADLSKSLSDGVLLCRVASIMFPDKIKKWNSAQSPKFKHFENIETFLKLLEDIGMPKKDLFQPIDLFEKKNMPQVLNSLMKLADTVHKQGFKIAWEKTQRGSLDFTPKEIQDAKKLENVNLWNKTTTVNEVL